MPLNNSLKFSLSTLVISLALVACGGSGSDDSEIIDVPEDVPEVATKLHDAYLDFDPKVSIILDGDEVVLETDGKPNHVTSYWDSSNASGLYIEADPAVTDVAAQSPGRIDEYNYLYSGRITATPKLAASSSETALGAVGIATSGSPIFNDQEGGNVPVSGRILTGFDRNGAHTGPGGYHYHLEPKVITNDDDSLVGVIADGFFLYGRKCYSTPNAYPTDLDASGGHVSITQHTGAADTDAEYHYHILNNLYLGEYYLAFGENYQGTPSPISR